MASAWELGIRSPTVQSPLTIISLAHHPTHPSIFVGLVEGVPTFHSILLCMTLAPLGLLSHAATRAVLRRA